MWVLKFIKIEIENENRFGIKKVTDYYCFGEGENWDIFDKKTGTLENKQRLMKRNYIQLGRSFKKRAELKEIQVYKKFWRD